MLDRLPIGKDGLVINKPIVVNWKIDEVFLLFGHFMSPMLIVMLLIYTRNNRKQLAIGLILMFFEIYLRTTEVYDYVMFD
jgi:hypothetical protein